MKPDADVDPPASGFAAWRREASRLDGALYAAIAQTPTPALDRSVARLARAADRSQLSLAAAAGIAAAGGRGGRRAALHGLAAIALTSTAVNLIAKPLSGRRRPDRDAARVVSARHVPMPYSAAFPSGHAASAFAFAAGVGRVLPHASVPLYGLAVLVAYSRVHAGVHYPGDVVAGALAGAALAQVTSDALDRRAAARR